MTEKLYDSNHDEQKPVYEKTVWNFQMGLQRISIKGEIHTIVAYHQNLNPSFCIHPKVRIEPFLRHNQ